MVCSNILPQPRTDLGTEKKADTEQAICSRGVGKGSNQSWSWKQQCLIPERNAYNRYIWKIPLETAILRAIVNKRNILYAQAKRLLQKPQKDNSALWFHKKKSSP